MVVNFCCCWGFFLWWCDIVLFSIFGSEKSKSTRVVQLRARCTDHWTTGQSHGVGVPAVQLTMHVKSSTLYGCTVIHPKYFQLDGLLLFCIIMGLCPASSAVKVLAHTFYCNFGQAEKYCLLYRGLCYIEVQ